MCSEDSSESDFDEQNLCLFEVCDICNDLVDALDMIVVDSHIICCNCFNEYLENSG